MKDTPIPGLHLVELTGQSPRQAPDPTKPWRLVVELTPPQFMQIAFTMLHGGTERVDVQGDTRESLEELMRRNDFRTHPRLRRLTLTGPEGVVLTMGRG